MKTLDILFGFESDDGSEEEEGEEIQTVELDILSAFMGADG